jgi:hypothetical protein
MWSTLLVVAALGQTGTKPHLHPPTIFSANPTAERATYRSLPLEQRPDRLGHFYGNAVRRNLRRRGN